MSAEDMDLGAVITSLRNKRASLDSAITALEALVSSGAASSDGTSFSTGVSFTGSGGGEVPDGAFHGLSMPAAIKMYLEMIRSKKTAREIGDGLKKGGLESTAKFFEKIVYSTLDRLRKSGDVVKIGNAWGLPNWFPALMRAGAKTGKASKVGKVGRPRKSSKRKDASDGPKLLAASTAKTPALKSEPSTSDMIDWFLRDNPGPHSPEEIQAATKIPNLNVARMVLGTMVKKGKIKKSEDGNYRKAS
jgi:hypothetical protein